MKKKIKIGCQEWCSIPDLSIRHMRAKIDTGARTSALHAEDIEYIEKSDGPYVKFKVHPFAGEVDTKKRCIMPVFDIRPITSSNSVKEIRYIIKTSLKIGGNTYLIELSLTNRSLMRFNILLGREALNKFAIIDPSKTYLLGPTGENIK
jgi:ribosomal protein S6--L-glutamate ligase